MHQLLLLGDHYFFAFRLLGHADTAVFAGGLQFQQPAYGLFYGRAHSFRKVQPRKAEEQAGPDRDQDQQQQSAARHTQQRGHGAGQQLAQLPPRSSGQFGAELFELQGFRAHDADEEQEEAYAHFPAHARQGFVFIGQQQGSKAIKAGDDALGEQHHP